MLRLFHIVFYQPIFNVLVYIYNNIAYADIGLTIIILTVLIKLILLPFSLSATRSQKALHKLQPKVEALKLQYKDNKEALSKALMQLYKEEKVNPFSSCLPLLIQLPFLFAIYKVFIAGLGNFKEASEELLYSFVHNPGTINSIAFGMIDLSQRSIILAFLAGGAQFFQTKMLIHTKTTKAAGPGAKDENALASMNKNMMYMMPIFTVFIGMNLPGGLALYWFVTTLLMILQQWIQFRTFKDAKISKEVID